MSVAPVEVFISYAHADEALRKELAKHLSLLQQRGLIASWYDRLIPAGAEWADEIDTHLNSAQLILLLISADFLASRYCSRVEMKRALERQEAGHARVIPIILRPVDWEQEPSLYKLQALPTNAKAVTTWPTPPTYDEAFQDIALGIRTAIEKDWNHPLRAKAGSHQVWNIPYRRNPYFTGQVPILTELHMTLTANKAAALTQTQAISGLGGIGKTQIALEYAYQHEHEYHALLWVQADTRDTLIAGFTDLAQLLHLPEQAEHDQARIVAAVKVWLETHDQWLLILDNADDLSLLDEFLPSRSLGHILLTTRVQAVGTFAYGIEVNPMEPAEGALLLLRRAKMLVATASLEQATEADRAHACEIVEALGGLPLALDQAAAYIEETQCGLSGYLASYQAERTTLLQRRGTLIKEHPEPVATTWSLSFAKVEAANPAATDLLRLCAFLHPEAIPEEMFNTGTVELGPHLSALKDHRLQWNEAIAKLLAFSLIRRNSGEKSLSLHRLVQEVLRMDMDESIKKTWVERTIRAANKAFPEVDFKKWSQCERYLPHALHCANLIDEYTLDFPEAASLLFQAAHYLYDRAQYPQAEPLYQQALGIYQKALGPEHPQTASVLHHLAHLYEDQDRFEEAEKYHKQELAIREKVLGSGHPDIATSLKCMGTLYTKWSKYDQAEAYYQRALAICEKVAGPEHSDTASVLHNLAHLYEDQDRFEEAERYHKRELAIREKMLGYEHPGTATSLQCMGTLYSKWGKYEQAEDYYQRALAICEKVVGPEHPQTATVLHNLAHLYEAQERFEEAERYHKRELAIREKVLVSEHPDIATSLRCMGNLYSKWSKYEQAEDYYQRALAILEKAFGSEHSDTASVLHNLAHLYEDQGKYEQAERYHKQELAIREKVLGSGHLSVATSLQCMGNLYSKWGKYDQAKTYYQQSLAIREMVLDHDHPDTTQSLNNLAALYRAQGRYAEAEPLIKRALAIREQHLGHDHPDIVRSLNNLAELYRIQGNYADAQPLYQRALAISKQLLGSDHPLTATVRKNYDNLQQSLRERR